jgi:RNA polymerase sigma-70 factor (ECF subfamily)
MPPTEQARWFSEQVLPCEPDLRAYLQARFPSLPDRDDLVQEVYLKALRARETGRLPCTRAFLFTAARNAAIDLCRRHRRLPHEEISESVEMSRLDETPDPSEALDRQQRLEVLLEAILALPERCRQVMILRHLDGFAYKEIAGQLGISAETVKVHMIKGVKDCTQFFEQRGLIERAAPAARLAS